MSRRAGARVGAGLALLAFCLAAPAKGAPPTEDPELAALARAAAAHPDDPDLDWARIRRLEELSQLAEATAGLERHLALWPGHRPGARALLGRWLYQLGRDAEAVETLEVALAEDAEPSADRAASELHLGLALHRLGRHREALPHFEQAARDPALSAEALLLAGLTRLDLGDREGARRDFERVQSEARGSDAARTAGLLLAFDGGAYPWLRLEGRASTRYDTNVPLESSDLPTRNDVDDWGFGWGASAELTPSLPGGALLSLGADYDDSAQLELDRYDTRRVAGSVLLRFPLLGPLWLDLDGTLAWYELGDDPYLLDAVVNPGLLVELPPHAGTLQLQARYGHAAYDEQALLSPLDRDGDRYGGGLRWLLDLPWTAGAISGLWVAPGVAYLREDDQDATELGFHNAYDHQLFGGELRSGAQLPLGLELTLIASCERALYDHPNLIDALLGGGGRKRRDTVVEVWGKVGRPIGRYLEVELFGTHEMDFSNVNAFDYDRTVVGLGLRVRSPR